MPKGKQFRYVSLTPNDLQILWDKHKRIIESFLSENKYNPDYLFVNEDIVLTVITKVDQRKEYFEFFHGLNMSEYKEAALTAFWYVKLRPISVRTNKFSEKVLKEYESINEKLAIFYLLRTLRKMLCKNGRDTNELNSLSEKYLKELVYTLAYRDISKEAFILLMETMAVFLGLDPYAPDEFPKTAK